VEEHNTDVIQGTLDMLILKTLSLEPMHGFGIGRRVEQISRGVFKVNPGSLLTALHAWNAPDGWMRSGARRKTRVVPESTPSRAPEEDSSSWRPPIGLAVRRPSPVS
jgi:hypothetical protein